MGKRACSLKMISLMQIHYALSSLTRSFLLSITAKNKKKHIKEPITESEVTIYYNSTNIINRRIL